MKRITALLAAGLMGTALTAQAQSPFNTGPYVGLGFGATLSESTVSVGTVNPLVADIRPTGPSFAGLLGFNFRLGSLGLGVEGEYDKNNWEGKSTTTGLTQTENSVKIDKGTRIRGRIGYVGKETFWFFAAGVSKADSTVHLESRSFPGDTSEATASLKGKNWGVGFEYAVGEGSIEKNFIVRVEYIADKFDAHTYTMPFSQNVLFSPRTVDEIKANTIRAVIAYNFF